MDGGAIRRSIAVTLATASAIALAVVFSSSAVAAAAPRASDCGGGAVMPATGGGYWHCSFSDEFDGSSLDRSKWLPQTGTTNGLISCFMDAPGNISVSGGDLKLTARQETAPVTCDPVGLFHTTYTAGSVSTAGRFSQTYGRFEVRAKITPVVVQGLQTAFWLWPVDSARYGSVFPASGEIDIAEMFSRYPDRVIPYIHYNPAAPDPDMTNNYCFVSSLGDFHDYVVEWTESSIKVIYDGWTCLNDHWNPAAPLSHPQPFDQPFFINLTQGFGVLGNSFDVFQTPLPASTDVDYVRVWKHSDQGGEAGAPGPETSGAPTGQRARALKKCRKMSKKKRAKKARKKCKKKAKKLPV
jgi:beta-glucanase (GH16 family)